MLMAILHALLIIGLTAGCASRMLDHMVYPFRTAQDCSPTGQWVKSYDKDGNVVGKCIVR